MTFESRYYAELRDVNAIRLSCANCKSSIAITPIDPNFIPSDRPHCKKTWFPENLVKWVPAMAMIALAVACDGGPPDLRSVYEEDNLHVGLLTVRGEEYSHPYVMSSIDMARVLGGLWCRNPNAVIPTFTDPQIERLAPHLAGALEQAADTDVITSTTSLFRTRQGDASLHQAPSI